MAIQKKKNSSKVNIYIYEMVALSLALLLAISFGTSGPLLSIYFMAKQIKLY